MNIPRWYRFFESLEAELKSFFSPKDLSMIFRRAGRRTAPPICDDPVSLLKRAGIPATQLEDRVHLEFSDPGRCLASWCAGFLETACGNKVIISHHDGKTYLQKDEDDSSPTKELGFDIAVSGALPPLQLAQLHDFSVDAMLFIDNAKSIRAWNKGAENMFGYSSQEAIGQPFDLLVPSDLRDSEELEELARKTEREGSINNHITRRVHKDGHELIVSLSRSKVVDRHDNQVGCAAILRDITEQERVKIELANAQSLAKLGEMSAQVAHEVRNPLAGIHGALQIMKRRAKKENSDTEIYEDVESEISRLDQLVTDLIRFGRPSASKLNAVEMKAWLNKWCETIEAESHERAFDINVGSLVEANCRIDTQLFTHVVRNFVENAIEASTGDCQIHLRSEISNGQFHLHIEDNGPGIPNEIREQVLSPFFTTKTRGSGLGLAICQRNMHTFGGNIELMPTAPGEGAHFCLRIPLAWNLP